MSHSRRQEMKKHFSHPHPLKLQKDDVDDEYIVCSGCEQSLVNVRADEDDPVYTCCKRDCEFFLHKSCSELARHLEHKSHPDHQLTLLSEPPEHSLYYDCNACGGVINGFSFHCNKCQDPEFRLHVKCAFFAESVDSKAHEHTLSVEYSGEDTVLCEVCDGCLTAGYWFYFCKECDFRTHLECAISAEGPPVKEVEEDEDEDEEGLSDEQRLFRANIRMQDQMARIEFQRKMAQLNAEAMSSLISAWRI